MADSSVGGSPSEITDDDVEVGMQCVLRWYRDFEGVARNAASHSVYAMLTDVQRSGAGRVFRVTARDEETGFEVEAVRHRTRDRIEFRGMAFRGSMAAGDRSGAFRLTIGAKLT